MTTLLDLMDGPALRDAALDAHEANKPTFLERCRDAARAVALREGEVSINDVRKAVAPVPQDIHPSVFGAVFRGPEWEVVGMAQATHADRNSGRRHRPDAAPSQYLAAEESRMSTYTKKMTMHLNGGSDYSKMVNRVYKDDEETDVYQHIETDGSPSYKIVSSVFLVGDQKFDVIATNAVGLIKWLDEVTEQPQKSSISAYTVKKGVSDRSP